MYYRTLIYVALVSIILSQVSSLSAFEQYAQAILSRAPEGWAIKEKHINVSPEGFYNKETKGELYVFCGPDKVTWNWKDKADIWHSEALAYESLEIWIFPGNYNPGIKTYLTIKGPIIPSKVYDSQVVEVYAMPSHYLIVSEDEFNKLIQNATSMYWDDSGGKHAISWRNWERDITIAIKSNMEIGAKSTNSPLDK